MCECHAGPCLWVFVSFLLHSFVVHGRADGGPLIVSSFQPCVLVGFLDKCLYFILCSGLWDVSDREEEAAPIS